MRNKFLNLILDEKNLQKKAAALALFALLSIVLLKAARLKQNEVDWLAQEKILVEKMEKKIPGLESKLKTLEVQGRLSSPLKFKPIFNLTGILTSGGDSTAIINGNVYQKSDVISGFTITNITSNTVTLRDKKTAEFVKIQLAD